ncbi:MAG: thymidine phosphorylase [Candidatus Delongbacteria bacterium]
MTPYEIIQKKQRGEANTAEEIRFMVAGALDGRVMEAQLSSWFMAIYFRDMNPEETWILTQAMRTSGEVLDFSALPGRKVDKHSTGGVGDKITFILAPLLAAVGLLVPSITGRGLGHTGGTLDKLESLPGLKTRLDQAEMSRVLQAAGHALVGQTENLVPADRLFYALRDVTATVESAPLICSSILSKKLAEGVDALVLDVKHGHGAIFQQQDQAEELARRLVATCTRGGLPVGAVLSDMNAPLGRQIGNWNELLESDECLQGFGSPDLVELTLALGTAALVLLEPGLAPVGALRRLKAALADGSARECYLRMIEAQGGSREWFLAPHHAPRPAQGRTITAARAGWVADIQSRELGLVGIQLGAGRARKEDGIDHFAGLTLHVQTGESVRAGQALCDIYAGPGIDLEALLERTRAAFVLAETRPERPAPIHTDARGLGWSSRVSATQGLPFSAAQWQELIRAEGLGLHEHPLSPSRLG